MLKKSLIAVALAAPLLWAAPAAAQTASQLAEKLKPAIGQSVGVNVVIAAAAAEGNTLVITVDGPKGWRGQMNPAQVSEGLVAGICSGSPQFFANGVTVRVDSLDGAQDLRKGPLVSACPKP